MLEETKIILLVKCSCEHPVQDKVKRTIAVANHSTRNNSSIKFPINTDHIMKRKFDKGKYFNRNIRMTARVKFWLLQTEVTIEVKTMEGKKPG